MFDSPLNLLNLVCGVFSILASLLIIRKDPGEWLNKALFLCFSCWALNILFYSLVFYPDIPSEVLNLLRDLNVAFGITAASFLFLAGQVLMRGDRAVKGRTAIGLIVLTLVLILTSLLSDRVVATGAQNEIDTTILASLTIFLVPGLVALAGIVQFVHVRRDLSDPASRKKILFFITGATSLVAGAFVFGLSGLLIGSEENLLVSGLALILWALGPVFVVWGFYKV